MIHDNPYESTTPTHTEPTPIEAAELIAIDGGFSVAHPPLPEGCPIVPPPAPLS